MKLSEISYKDVIREEDGTKLGKISDVTIDIATGKILSIHISSGFRLMGLFNNYEENLIPWSRIVKIGSDVIIVETVHKLKTEIEEKT